MANEDNSKLPLGSIRASAPTPNGFWSAESFGNDDWAIPLAAMANNQTKKKSHSR
jgi:hypothetical protein